MKKIYTMIVVLALALPAVMAQEHEEESSQEKQKQNQDNYQTLFDSQSGSGGYGAITIGYTRINSRDAILMGARGEWLIGKGLGLGMGGYGFMNDPVYNTDEDLNYSLAGGYGGLIIEPILFGWYPVHLSLPILIGGGGVANTSYSADYYDHYEDWSGYMEDATAYFVAEFGAELEFNVVRFLRLALYGSYRYTSDINMIDVSTNALRGWSTGMTFKFGSF
jgi:opacity protein-like surface antigen